MHTIKNKWSRPTLLEFNDCLKENAEAHEMIKVTSLKPKSDDNLTTIASTKTALKIFASTSKADAPTIGRSVFPTQPVKYTACKETHPCDVALCLVGRHQRREQKLSLITTFDFRA